MGPAGRISVRMKLIRRLAAVCVAILPWTSSRHADAAAPLVLAKTGYLYAGGKIDTSLPGSPMIGQMWLNFQNSTTDHHTAPPIVMIHGGSQTGTNFTGTPDGREGWAQYFLRRGYAVYVVDQVARGRAGYWTPSYGPVTSPELERTLQRFAAPERYNLWPQAHLHTQWPGAANPGDAAFDAFYATQFPSLTSFLSGEEILRSTGAAITIKSGCRRSCSPIRNPVRWAGRSPTNGPIW